MYNLKEQKAYEEKLKALKQYQKETQNQRDFKAEYNQAKKQFERQEFASSPVGKFVSGVKKFGTGVASVIQRRDPRMNVSQSKFTPAPQLTKEQTALTQLFGGGSMSWGTGENLPRMNKQLFSGGGLIKNGDVDKETASMFGL